MDLPHTAKSFKRKAPSHVCDIKSDDNDVIASIDRFNEDRRYAFYFIEKIDLV